MKKDYKTLSEQYVRKQLELSEDEPLALQHWLRALEALLGKTEYSSKANFVLQVRKHLSSTPSDVVTFNLTTGQPATEEDYKAFLEIVGV